MAKDNSYLLGMYEKAMPIELSWREKLQRCHDCGFDYLEISIDESDKKIARLDSTAEERRELLLLTKELNIPILTMCLSAHRRFPLGSLNPVIQSRSLEIMKKAILFARDMGIRIIQLAGYDVYYEKGNSETKKEFIKNLQKAVSFAAENAVIMGFETMETAFMDTVGKAMEYVKMINSPYLGIYPDIGNLTNSAKLYDHNLTDDLLQGKGHIFAAHLKETKPGIYREVPFGTGHTEFVQDIEVLKQLGVRLYTGEFWHDKNDDDYLLTCKKSAAFLRDKLDEVFRN